MIRIGHLRQHAAARAAGSRPAHWPAWAATVLPQALALIAAALIYLLGPDSQAQPDTRIWAVLALSFAGLRVATIRAELVASTYVLDAVGVAVFIGGTGGVSSPFVALALAGAWWAAQKAGRGSLYGLAFAAAYMVLVAPQAIRDADFSPVLYQMAFVWAIGAFGDRLRATAQLAGARGIPDAAAQNLQGDSLKAGLGRAVDAGRIPIDELLTGGQLGLTVVQTELIPYLILGLSNQEIADALSVSEATVRYRLTRLYRALDVRGRKAAADRARELGLAALLPATAPHHA